MPEVIALEAERANNYSLGSARAKLIRNKQATAMLQSALGISRVIEGLKMGIPAELAVDDLIEIEAYLRETALS